MLAPVAELTLRLYCGVKLKGSWEFADAVIPRFALIAVVSDAFAMRMQGCTDAGLVGHGRECCNLHGGFAILCAEIYKLLSTS